MACKKKYSIGGKAVTEQGYKDNSPFKNRKQIRIDSNNITMKGVSKPIIATTPDGKKTLMLPENNYYFPGAQYVDETPVMKRGGRLKKYKYQSGGENKSGEPEYPENMSGLNYSKEDIEKMNRYYSMVNAGVDIAGDEAWPLKVIGTGMHLAAGEPGQALMSLIPSQGTRIGATKVATNAIKASLKGAKAAKKIKEINNFSTGLGLLEKADNVGNILQVIGIDPFKKAKDYQSSLPTMKSGGQIPTYPEFAKKYANGGVSQDTHVFEQTIMLSDKQINELIKKGYKIEYI